MWIAHRSCKQTETRVSLSLTFFFFARQSLSSLLFFIFAIITIIRYCTSYPEGQAVLMEDEMNDSHCLVCCILSSI